MNVRRYFELVSRMLCLSVVPTVTFAFWDPYFHPLIIKELLIEGIGLLAFLTWWIARGPGEGAIPLRAPLPNPLRQPLFYLCLIALLSIIWTEPKALAFKHWTSLVGLFLLIPPLFDFGRTKRFRITLRNTFLLTGTVLIILAAFQINGFSLDGLLRVGGSNYRTRVSLTIGHNNGVAPILLAYSFLALSAIGDTRRFSWRLALITFAGASWALILFFLLTRSTMLGLLAGGLILIGLNLAPVLSRRSRESFKLPPVAKWALISAMVALVTLVVAGGVSALRGGAIEGEFNPNLARNIGDRLRTFNPDFLLRDSRARLWAVGATMMRDHPFLGVGFSSAKMDYPQYQAQFFERYPDFPAGPTFKHTEGLHNDYLQWWAETGMLGAVVLFWALLAFVRTILVWYRDRARHSPGQWFGESAVLVALLVVLMDGVFSFPGHISPINVHFPGLMMLWMGCVYGQRSLARSPAQVQIPLRFNARLILGGVVWVIIALPLGVDKEKVPALTRLIHWSPLTTQIIGQTWHYRLNSVRLVFSNRLRDVQNKITSGVYVPQQEIEESISYAARFRERCAFFPKLIPFAGESIFDAADGTYDIYRFYKYTRAYVHRLFSEQGKVPELVSKEYNESGEILKKAEELYELTLENYRYHSLYWLLGLVQLERTGLAGTTPEVAEQLIESGRNHMATARRILFQPDRLYQEIEVGLKLKDEKGVGPLIGELVERDPNYILNDRIPHIAKSDVVKDVRTGGLKLQPYAVAFFREMLPFLDKDHVMIVRDSIPILDRGQARELAQEYMKRDEEISTRALNNPFWKFRLGSQPTNQEEFNAEIETYRKAVAERAKVQPLQRALYLSDLQRFAPAGTDFTEWRAELAGLLMETDHFPTRILAYHTLAQDAYARGDLQGAWKLRLMADAQTVAGIYPFVSERRLGVVDSALWGITWPLLIR